MMENSFLFSVLIANYNNGSFLMSAINSVRSQTYLNWEIVLVDDASTDSSLDLYKVLEQDERIHIYHNEKNYGCGYTKRRCIEIASGTFCGFLDPDDTLEPNALEVMVAEHLTHPNASLVYSRYYDVDVNLSKIGISKNQCVLPNNVSFLEYGNGAISHFVSFKKACYDRTPGIDPFYQRAVDHALYYLLEEVGDTCFVDTPLYNYRSDTGFNISTKSNSNKALYWDLIVMSDACRRRGLSIEGIVFNNLDHLIHEEKTLSFIQGRDSMRATTTYRIGSCIVRPIKLLKSIK